MISIASTLSSAASQERPAENLTRDGPAFVPLALSGHLANLTYKFLGAGIQDLSAFAVKLYGSLAHGTPIGSRAVVPALFVHGYYFIFTGATGG